MRLVKNNDIYSLGSCYKNPPPSPSSLLMQLALTGFTRDAAASGGVKGFPLQQTHQLSGQLSW